MTLANNPKTQFEKDKEIIDYWVKIGIAKEDDWITQGFIRRNDWVKAMNRMFDKAERGK